MSNYVTTEGQLQFQPVGFANHCMGKILNFFAKFSFLGYMLQEHKVTKHTATMEYVTVSAEKDRMAEFVGTLSAAVDEVANRISNDTAEINNRPVVKNRETFFDETGLTPAQMRAKQLSVLNNLNRYNALIDRESDDINNLNNIKTMWEKKLATKVVVKAKKVSSRVINQICDGLYNVTPNELANALHNGGAISKIFSYNEAEIIINRLSAYKIKAKSVELNAEASVKEQTKSRDSEYGLKRVARNQRFFISALVFLFFALIFISNGQPFSKYYWILLVGVGGAVLVFVILWLLTKPILALAWRLTNKSFKKNANVLIARIGYLRGVMLSEEYENGLDILYKGLLKCIEEYDNNYNTVRNYALAFLPQKVVDGLLPYVIEQMSIGATFNDALYKTEATIDRRIAQQKAEERAARLEKENLRHNAEMEEQARRRAEAEQQRAEAARQAAYEIKRNNELVRENTKAENEHTKQLRELNRKIKG